MRRPLGLVPSSGLVFSEPDRFSVWQNDTKQPTIKKPIRRQGKGVRG